MRILKTLLTICFALLLFALPLPQAALAASSSLIRAYDDVKVTSKDFSNQNLTRAEFSNAKLAGANFSGADLRGAVFNSTDLNNANFQGANFSNGIAYLSDFSGADLQDAVFDSAMLLKSTFQNADVTGADFSLAVLDRDQVQALCQSASGVNSVTGVATRDSLECP